MFIEERKKYFFFFDQLKYCVDKFVGRNLVLQTYTHIPLLQSKRKVKFSQIKGNGKKFSHIELSNSWIFEQCGKEGLCYFIFPTGFEARQKLDWKQILVVLYTLFFYIYSSCPVKTRNLFHLQKSPKKLRNICFWKFQYNNCIACMRVIIWNAKSHKCVDDIWKVIFLYCNVKWTIITL